VSADQNPQGGDDAGIAACFSLAGRTAIVTGAASGIGAGIAALLAEAGARVVIADRDETGVRRETARLLEAGHEADSMVVDLASEASIVKACAKIVERHGSPWLLVNNAGVHDREPLLEATVAEWDRINAINARGPFLMIREIARAMVAHGQGGRIVNVASNCVWAPMVVGLTSYAASKGAMLALSQTSAFELVGDRITVNTVLPGGVATPGAKHAQGPAPRGPASERPPPLGMCEPRDIAAAILFFATPAARFITNQVIAVDAGFSLT
jgi:NAD(P)-dependent dehydrogenase (short-subunit alcohol dehydrogenase family)